MPKQRATLYKDTSLQQLRTFLVVVREQGFSAAARELEISTPTAWEQVRALERDYKVQLLKRVGRRVEPTKAAIRLAEIARRVLAELDSTGEVLRQEEGVLPDQITIVCGLRMFMDELCGVISRFQSRYPQVRLKVVHSSSDNVESLVAEGSVDLALALEPFRPGERETLVDFEVAYEVDYLLVAPPDHPLIKKRVLQIEDVIKNPLILSQRGTYTRQRVEEVLHRYDLLSSLSVSVETGNGAFTIQCVREGMGVGIVGGDPNGWLTSGLGVRPLRKWFGSAKMAFVWRRGAIRPPLVVELADEIRKAIKSSAQNGAANTAKKTSRRAK